MACAKVVDDGAFRTALIDRAEREAEAEAELESEDTSAEKGPDLSSLTEAQKEQTRALRKKFELQQKLKAKRAAEKIANCTPEDLEREAVEEQKRQAKEVAKAIETIEQDMDKEEEPKPEKIKIGNKMVVTADGEMSKEESIRLQAQVGAGKSSKLKAFFQLQGQTREIDESEVQPEEVVSFYGCKGCDFTLNAMCTKVFIEKCEDFILRLNGKILTSTVEIDACEKMNLLACTPIGTLQVERCSKMNILYQDKSCFAGFVIWAGCFMMRVQVEDSVMSCDFGLTQKLDQTINIERTQFKVWLNPQGKLTCDKVIRLKNGFPSTKREDDEHTRREEQQLQELAKRMGVTVHRKEDLIGGRIKPNELCPCGSGLKYKKCCMK